MLTRRRNGGRSTSRLSTNEDRSLMDLSEEYEGYTGSVVKGGTPRRVFRVNVTTYLRRRSSERSERDLTNVLPWWVKTVLRTERSEGVRSGCLTQRGETSG